MECKIDCKSVGERIKARKHALGITANDLYEKSGVPLDTINNIVYGRSSDPRIESLARIAVALDTTLDHIVFGKNPDPQTPVKEDPQKEHKCYFDSERYIQILTNGHEREMAAQAKAKDEIIEELRGHLTFWRKLSCVFMVFLGAILVVLIIGQSIG